jgi:hypothetical protein
LVSFVRTPPIDPTDFLLRLRCRFSTARFISRSSVPPRTEETSGQSGYPNTRTQARPPQSANPRRSDSMDRGSRWRMCGRCGRTVIQFAMGLCLEGCVCAFARAKAHRRRQANSVARHGGDGLEAVVRALLEMGADVEAAGLKGRGLELLREETRRRWTRLLCAAALACWKIHGLPGQRTKRLSSTLPLHLTCLLISVDFNCLHQLLLCPQCYRCL